MKSFIITITCHIIYVQLIIIMVTYIFLLQ